MSETVLPGELEPDGYRASDTDLTLQAAYSTTEFLQRGCVEFAESAGVRQAPAAL